MYHKTGPEGVRKKNEIIKVSAKISIYTLE